MLVTHSVCMTRFQEEERKKEGKNIASTHSAGIYGTKTKKEGGTDLLELGMPCTAGW